MAMEKVSLATIHLIDDGSLQQLFDRAIKNALADCDDRPADETAREVTLKFSIVPVSATGRSCERVSIDAQVNTKVPAYRTTPTDVSVRKDKNGFMGLFNPMAPEDAEQRTLDEQK